MASGTSSTPLPEAAKESVVARVSDPTSASAFPNIEVNCIYLDGRDLLFLI